MNIEFPFTTITPVRITDINYGKHLGHIATIGIFHNARVLFLNTCGFDELNIDNLGMILINSSYSFKNEADFNTQLKISVDIGAYSKLRFNFIYTAIDLTNNKEIADGREEFVFLNYLTKKTAKIPKKFLDFCNITQSKKSK